MNMNYRVDDDKLRSALKRGARRSRWVTATSSMAAALLGVIALTATSAAVSPAFAQQLAKLPVIGQIVSIFRPDSSIEQAFERGYGVEPGIVKNNDAFEVAVDGLMASENGFTLIYRYRWLNPPGGRSVDVLFDDGILVNLDAVSIGGETYLPNGGGSTNQSDDDGWHLCSARMNERLPAGRITLRFGYTIFNDAGSSEASPALDIEMDYAPSVLKGKTIVIDKTVDEYTFGTLTITPHQAEIDFTRPAEGGVQQPQDMLFITDQAGRLWFQTSGGESGAEDAELVEGTVCFESPYFTDSALTLHRVAASSEGASSEPKDYHITPDGKGGFLVPDGLVLIDAKPVDDGHSLSVRMDGLPEDARGFLASLHDQSFRYIVGNDQIFTFEMKREWGELWLSSAVWTAQDQIDVPLSE